MACDVKPLPPTGTEHDRIGSQRVGGWKMLPDDAQEFWRFLSVS